MATDKPTQLGTVGLGRMGSNLARRLTHDGAHRVARTGWSGPGDQAPRGAEPEGEQFERDRCVQGLDRLGRVGDDDEASAATAWISSAW